MVRIVVALVDDEAPEDKAEASINAEVLEKCASSDDIRRVVGNLFLTLVATLHDNDPGEEGRVEVEKTIKTRL